MKCHGKLVSLFCFVFLALVSLLAYFSPLLAAPPKPTRPDCRCQSVEIFCSKEKVAKLCPKDAKSCVAECQILGTSPFCKERGLENGLLTLAELEKKLTCDWKKIEELLNSGAKPNTIGKVSELIENCGTFVREAFQLCVPEELRNVRAGTSCLEWAGALQERETYIGAIQTFCAKKILSDSERELCRLVCEDAYLLDVRAEWNQCLCNQIDPEEKSPGDDWLTRSECCDCLSSCEQGKLSATIAWVPEYCQREVYLSKEFLSSNPTKLKSTCRRFAFETRGTTCREMSERQAQYECPEN